MHTISFQQVLGHLKHFLRSSHINLVGLMKNSNFLAKNRLSVWGGFYELEFPVADSPPSMSIWALIVDATIFRSKACICAKISSTQKSLKSHSKSWGFLEKDVRYRNFSKFKSKRTFSEESLLDYLLTTFF